MSVSDVGNVSVHTSDELAAFAISIIMRMKVNESINVSSSLPSLKASLEQLCPSLPSRKHVFRRNACHRYTLIEPRKVRCVITCLYPASKQVKNTETKSAKIRAALTFRGSHWMNNDFQPDKNWLQLRTSLSTTVFLTSFTFWQPATLL